MFVHALAWSRSAAAQAKLNQSMPNRTCSGRGFSYMHKVQSRCQDQVVPSKISQHGLIKTTHLCTKNRKDSKGKQTSTKPGINYDTDKANSPLALGFFGCKQTRASPLSIGGRALGATRRARRLMECLRSSALEADHSCDCAAHPLLEGCLQISCCGALRFEQDAGQLGLINAKNGFGLHGGRAQSCHVGLVDVLGGFHQLAEQAGVGLLVGSSGRDGCFYEVVLSLGTVGSTNAMPAITWSNFSRISLLLVASEQLP